MIAWPEISHRKFPANPSAFDRSFGQNFGGLPVRVRARSQLDPGDKPGSGPGRATNGQGPASRRRQLLPCHWPGDLRLDIQGGHRFELVRRWGNRRRQGQSRHLIAFTLKIAGRVLGRGRNAFDPFGPMVTGPGGHNQPQGTAMQNRQRLAVHTIGQQYIGLEQAFQWQTSCK